MENLDSDVMQEEIKKAMLDYGPDKSSVPDGWTFDFIRKFWYLIEANVVVVVMEFLNSYKFPKVCNPSIIALIPKFCDSNCVKDFHPISLLGCRYKIISKFLANHLMLVIEAFEWFEQPTFVRDPKILDGPMIMNEVVVWCKEKHKKSLIFKIDLEKAYDSVW